MSGVGQSGHKEEIGQNDSMLKRLKSTLPDNKAPYERG